MSEDDEAPSVCVEGQLAMRRPRSEDSCVGRSTDSIIGRVIRWRPSEAFAAMREMAGTSACGAHQDWPPSSPVGGPPAESLQQVLMGYFGRPQAVASSRPNPRASHRL